MSQITKESEACVPSYFLLGKRLHTPCFPVTCSGLRLGHAAWHALCDALGSMGSGAAKRRNRYTALRMSQEDLQDQMVDGMKMDEDFCLERVCFFWCWERHHYHSFVTRMVDAVFYSEAINELYCNSMWFHPFWSRLLRIRYVSSARARDNYWHHQRPQNMCEETWEKIRHVYSSVWSAAGQSRKRRQCW